MAAVEVDSREATVFPGEEQLVTGAVEKRKREFRAGRHAARLALAELGGPACVIPRLADRRPLWPGGFTGSITHAGRIAVAAVSRVTTVQALGVDLEERARLTSSLHEDLFTPAERRINAKTRADWPTLLFSAKEAAYKAVNPVSGKFFGFQEAEVGVEWEAGEFTVRYTGMHEPTAYLMSRGSGRFFTADDYVFTCFVIGPEV
jgi:4'-phosphopantetheinyl transferase EntD